MQHPERILPLAPRGRSRRRVQIGLVDDDDVGQLDDALLDRLQIIARVWKLQQGEYVDHLYRNEPLGKANSPGYAHWNGPYLKRLEYDPWYRAYTVVAYPLNARDGFGDGRVCIVVCAGPNGRMDGDYSSPRDPVAAGDDLIEVVTPDDYMGAVNGDLMRRRGQIEKTEPRPGGAQVITAFVPLSEMFGYTTDLRSATQGRATSTMHFERYDQAPKNVAEEVIAKVQGVAK